MTDFALPAPVPTALLFDWDNTLVDSWSTIAETMSATMEAMGKPARWTLADTQAQGHGSLRDQFPRLFGERWQEARDFFYRQFKEIHLETLKPMPGAEAALSAASKLNIPLAIVSNKSGLHLRREISYMGWDDLFVTLVGAEDAIRDKPDPAPVFLALKDTGIPPSDAVWLIGDSAVDVACARASRCFSVLICPEPSMAEQLAPDLNVVDCKTLTELLISYA